MKPLWVDNTYCRSVAEAAREVSRRINGTVLPREIEGALRGNHKIGGVRIAKTKPQAAPKQPVPGNVLIPSSCPGATGYRCCGDRPWRLGYIIGSEEETRMKQRCYTCKHEKRAAHSIYCPVKGEPIPRPERLNPNECENWKSIFSQGPPLPEPLREPKH